MTKNDKSVDDGGPAFATSCANETQHMVQEGMSLRDYFAAAALTGLLASHAHPQSQGPCQATAEQHAKVSFEIADAMVRSRKEPRS